MRKNLIVLSACMFIAHFSIAQRAAKSIYAELGGPGLASFNYDTRFSKREDGLGGRIGFGGFSIDGTGIIFVPIGLTYLLGNDQRHYFEVGGGATIVSISGNIVDDGSFTGTFGHLNLGYRLQPKEGGLLFRAAIVPIFGKGGFVPYYAGIAFGYKF